jgi:hypothetical protein
MRKTAHVQRRFDTEHRILDKLAKILPVGEPKSGMSYPAVAEEMGEAAHAVLLAKKTMEDAGILRTTLEYPKGQSGRVSVWELTMPVDLAHKEMSREHELQLSRPSRKAARLRRVAQPGEPAGMQDLNIPTVEESEALLREARQYMSRYDTAREYLRKMREQGIDVRDDAISFSRDERLETVARVLPAIDELVRERDRLQDQVDRWLHRRRRADGEDSAAAN